MNISIDSKLIKKSIQENYDYTSIQVLSLLHTSIKTLIERNLIIFEDKFIKIGVSEITWDDDTLVTSKEYVLGILSVLKYNHNLHTFFINNVEELKSKKNSIEITFNCSKYVMLDILKLPNFCPICSSNVNKYSGEFIINKNVPLILFNKETNQKINIFRCKSPYLNISKFNKFELDITCDTSFPYTKFNNNKNNHHESHFGLYGFFVLNIKNNNLRTLIFNIIRNTNFTITKNGFWQRIFIGKKNQNSIHKSKEILTIVYDDFYPNMSICKELKKNIENQTQITCELVKDNYYDSKKNYSIRFYISYLLGNNKSLKNLGLFSLLTQAQKKDYYFSYKLGVNTNDYNSFEQKFLENDATLMLFKINSHWLNNSGNKNPLTTPFL